MKNLKMKALALGLLSTVVISSTPVAAATNSTTTKAPVKTAAKIIMGFNYGPNGGPSANTIIGNGGVIQEGDVGRAVKDVQRQLYLRGYLSSSGIDGYFGQGTKKAVEDYQRKVDSDAASEYHSIPLSIDGVVGAQTWAYLHS